MVNLRALVGITMLLPTLVVAQNAELRSTIEASLRTDPRAAALSSAEFESLVQALMQEAEEQGQISELLATESSFGEDRGFAPPATTSTIITPALLLAVFLFAVAVLVILRRVLRRTSVEALPTST